MKKNLALTLLLGLALGACSDKHDEPALPEGITTVALSPKSYNLEGSPSDLPGENVLNEMSAYHFEDGKLKHLFTELTPYDGNKFQLDVTGMKGNVYFMANSREAVNKQPIYAGMAEDDFLELTSAPGKAPSCFMTGRTTLQGNERAVSLDMKHGVARVDLLMATNMATVNSISIAHVAQSGYLYEKADVQTAPQTTYEDLNKKFDTPQATSVNGLFYLCEQQNDQLEVTIHTTVNGQSKPLTGMLPATIKRNAVYAIKLTGNDIELKMEIEEWNEGDKPGATADLSGVVRVDRERSQLPNGVNVIQEDSFDIVEIPYTATQLLLALATDTDVELLTQEAAAQGISIEPLTDGSNGYLNNSFRISTPLRTPGKAIAEVTCPIKFKQLNNVYADRIKFRLKPNENQFGGQLAFTNGLTCDFDRYIDNELGTLTPVAGKQVSIEYEDPNSPWLKAMESDETPGTWRIVAGWRPNDQQADGRKQWARIVLSNPDGTGREEYTIVRRNYGLPVTLMNGVYWCKYNARGDSRNFDDQISPVSDPAAQQGLSVLEYLNQCTPEEYLELWPWSCQGNKMMRVVEKDGVATHDGFVPGGISNTNQLDPHLLAPDGYELPPIEYYNRIFQEWWMYIDRSGGPYNVYSPWEGNKQVFVESGSRSDISLGTITLPQTFHFEVYNKHNGLKDESVTFYGPGAQWSTAGINHNKLLFACYAANGSGWYNGQWGLQFNGGGPKDTRILRFIKSDVEFIY